jgi:cephalosporin-C deacetylase-like acetyl esterase
VLGGDRFAVFSHRGKHYPKQILSQPMPASAAFLRRPECTLRVIAMLSCCTINGVISEPEDYGLNAEQTLAHRLDSTALPPEGFDEFWRETRGAIEAIPASFRGTLEGPINQVVFESWRAVRIVGRLTLPMRAGAAEGTPCGAVITSHGYETEDCFPEAPEPWTERGLATLRIRVRGYPPSTMDTGDLRHDWILRGIESREAWIARGAVVDVIQAYRCLRRRFGPELPISLHGESFGGGLAVIATAQLAAMGDPPFRLAIGLPSLGDWRWRAGRYCNGSGGRVNATLELMRQEADRVIATLLMCDAAIHAARVTSPVVCKLAIRDDVVPAPSAAAVFNSLQSPLKAAFTTSYGHFEAPLSDLRRHAQFERLHPEFFDPSTPADRFLSQISRREGNNSDIVQIQRERKKRD